MALLLCFSHNEEEVSQQKESELYGEEPEDIPLTEDSLADPLAISEAAQCRQIIGRCHSITTKGSMRFCKP